MGFIHAALPSGELLVFGFDGDGPDKTEQLARNRCHDLILVFAPGRQCLVTLVQALLGLPGDRFHLFAQAQTLLPPQQKAVPLGR